MQVATGSADAESYLVFAGGFLVAVLVRLSDQNEEASGQWFLEAGFGRVDNRHPPTFVDLDQAQSWITDQLRYASLLQTHAPPAECPLLKST